MNGLPAGTATEALLQRLGESGLVEEFPGLVAYVAPAEARPAFRRAFEARRAVFERSEGRDGWSDTDPGRLARGGGAGIARFQESGAEGPVLTRRAPVTRAAIGRWARITL